MEHTWYELDEANKADGHYSRYPIYIAQAQEMYHKASALYTKVCDQVEAGTANGFDVAEAWDAYMIVNQLQTLRYHNWMIDIAVSDASGECECTPNRDTACAACRARAQLMERSEQ